MTDNILGFLTIILWVLVIAITLLPFVKSKVLDLLRKNERLVLWSVFVLSLSAMLGSLWYSDIIGYDPCRLCWYQRIFMYPIVLVSFLALVYKDFKSLVYIKGLAFVGLVIAVFHIIEQRLPQAGLSCGSIGQAVSCDTLSVNAFNLVTIPTMAATIFVSILLSVFLYEKTQLSDNRVGFKSKIL